MLVVLATVLVYFLFSSVQRFTSLLTLFDAGGLALSLLVAGVGWLATRLVTGPVEEAAVVGAVRARRSR